MHTEPGPSSVVCRRKLFSTWLSVVCLALSGSSAQAQTAADTGASSLRGNITGELRVEVLTEGVHSGDASGLVPSSFRILRQVLERLEDSATGRLLPPELHCDVPPERVAQARATAAILGDDLFRRFPWVHYDCGGTAQSVLPMTGDAVDALFRRFPWVHYDCGGTAQS
ncbi:MAG TPA: peptidase dimerization domain-containing protein, partial [Candidatus Obscuribacter sp.]|nr:peptidase dimerization domain-containing protein [Candidatus Obscuribacter sp.]